MITRDKALNQGGHSSLFKRVLYIIMPVHILASKSYKYTAGRHFSAVDHHGGNHGFLSSNLIIHKRFDEVT